MSNSRVSSGLFCGSDQSLLIEPKGYLLQHGIDQKDLFENKKKEKESFTEHGPSDQEAIKKTTQIGFEAALKKGDAVSKVIDQLGGQILAPAQITETMKIGEIKKKRKVKRKPSLLKSVVHRAVGSKPRSSKKGKKKPDKSSRW